MIICVIICDNICDIITQSMNTQLWADTAGKWWAHLFNIEECNGCSSQISLPKYDLGTTWLYHAIVISLLYHVMSLAV